MTGDIRAADTLRSRLVEAERSARLTRDTEGQLGTLALRTVEGTVDTALTVFADWLPTKERIALAAKVLYEHREPADLDGQFRDRIRCACGWSAKREYFDLDQSRAIWWAHQALAVLRALADEISPKETDHG